MSNWFCLEIFFINAVYARDGGLKHTSMHTVYLVAFSNVGSRACSGLCISQCPKCKENVVNVFTFAALL